MPLCQVNLTLTCCHLGPRINILAATIDDRVFTVPLWMGWGLLAVVVVLSLCCLAALACFCLKVKAVLHNPAVGGADSHDGDSPEGAGGTYRCDGAGMREEE